MTYTAVHLLLSCVAAATSTHVFGRFGDQIIPSEIEFGDDEMIATISRPVKAQDTFRVTSNLHIFSTHVVAVRNSMERECYVYRFEESLDIMLGRVQNAESNNGELNNVMENRLSLNGNKPLPHHTVQLLLGLKVATFCDKHAVYLVSRMTRLFPKDISLTRRANRLTHREVDFASWCDMCTRDEKFMKVLNRLNSFLLPPFKNQ